MHVRSSAQAVLFLGASAADWAHGVELLAYGGGVALVILAVSAAVVFFQRVHQREPGHGHVAAHHEAAEEHPAD